MPLFIVMRALGVLSDYDIIQTCLLDLEKNKSYVDLFIPCVYDAAKIFTQDTAIRYIATFTKGKTAAHVLDILTNLFLPHVGDMNFREKAYYLGFMAFKLMKVAQKEEPPTDRDNFKYKRVELAGTLLHSLFKEYYKKQQVNIFQNIDKEYYYHAGQYEGDRSVDLIKNNTGLIFKDRMVEDGFRKAFKGNWGAEAHTKRPGVVQDLNRLSFNSALAQRRKINLPMDESAKVVGPRLLHGSQWGIIDPLDTPDGGNVGLHKHMSIAAQISTGYSKTQMLPVLERSKMVSFLGDATPALIAAGVKVLLNGDWVGITQQPKELKNVLIFMRRIALIPNHTSITWNIEQQTFEINTDAGRLR
jgi:DNA-directed RNA polymerase II subunit RPB2